MSDEADEADLQWSEKIGALIADELAIGTVISSEQISRATEIAAQQIYICLVSGLRPPNKNQGAT